jgi:hypothetical protein
MHALVDAQLTAASSALLPGLGVFSIAHVLPFHPRPKVDWAMSPIAYTPTAWQPREGTPAHPTADSPSPGTGVVGFGGFWGFQMVPFQRSAAVWKPNVPTPTHDDPAAQLTPSNSALGYANDWSDHARPFQAAAMVPVPAPLTE